MSIPLFKQSFLQDDSHTRSIDDTKPNPFRRLTDDTPEHVDPGLTTSQNAFFRNLSTKANADVQNSKRFKLSRDDAENAIGPGDKDIYAEDAGEVSVLQNLQPLKGSNVPTQKHVPLNNFGLFPPPLNFNAARRNSVSAETLTPNVDDDKDFVPVVYPKTPEQLEKLSKIVVQIVLFSGLDEGSLKTVLLALKEVRYPKGYVINRQNDEGKSFYVIEEGEVEFFINDKKVNSAGAGSSFGELALMYNAPRAATVIAETAVVLWELDRVTFRKIVLRKTAKQRQAFENLLKDDPVFSRLSLYERSKLADALETKSFQKGDKIINEGEPGEKFYLVLEGTADVVKEGHGVVQRIKKGDYFGEVSLLHDKPRQASVFATSNLKVAMLDKHGFQRLLGPAVEVLRLQDPTRRPDN